MKSIVELLNELKAIEEFPFAERFHLPSLDAAYHRKLDFDNWLRRCVELSFEDSQDLEEAGASKKASARKAQRRPPRNGGSRALRLGDLDTRIRGMNIAAASTREYLKQAGKPRVWPALHCSPSRREPFADGAAHYGAGPKT